MKISVNSKVRLNGVGITGAVFFVGGPLASAWVYATAMEKASRGLRYGLPASDVTGDLWMAAFCGAASLAGLVMVLAGREYDHTVEINKEQPPQA